MNKQRYLAELQRLLVFMTPEDRDAIVRRYAALFDSVGPDGEAELIGKIGSPTKAAISLSRGYEAGRLPEQLPGAPALPEKPKPALTETTGDPWGDLPNYDLPGYEEPKLPLGDTQAQPGGEEFSMPDLPGYYPARTASRAAPVRRSVPLWLGIPLYLIIVIALGIPLAVACVVIFLALLVPGLLVLFGTYLVFVGGLWCLSFMADAILLFGASFIVLSFGIIILFGGLWLGVRLMALYSRGIGWITGVLLGRRTAEYA